MMYVFSAYPNIAINCCGGTIAKYSAEGESITPVIFSFGENTNPLLDPSHITAQLIKESRAAFKLLRCKPIFLGLPDKRLRKRITDSKIETQIKQLLRKSRPEIIFTHDIYDANPTYRKIAKFIEKTVAELKLKTRIYAFRAEFPIKLIKREVPKLYVDITDRYAAKQEAINQFKSHELFNNYHLAISHLNDRVYGLRIGVKYAEVFYRSQ